MNILRLGFPLLTLILLSSCASVSVKGVQRTTRQPVRKPGKIYVAEFDCSHGAYKIAGTENKEPEAFKCKTAASLAKYVARTISDHVAPAVTTQTTQGLPHSGWLITGEFVRVNTGSRELRAIVGLGAGGTKMETRVSVTDLSGNGKPFLTFDTTGGSNAMPGLLESSGPGSAAISMATQSMMGVTDDTARTSRMIAGELNSYLIQRGWLSKDQAYSVKTPGKYQLVHEQYFR
jgi:hypothetical protein